MFKQSVGGGVLNSRKVMKDKQRKKKESGGFIAFFRNSYPCFKKKIPVLSFAMVMGLFRMVILLVTPQVVLLLVDRVIDPLLGGGAGEGASIFSFLLTNVAADDYVKIFFILGGAMLVSAALFFVCFYLKWNLAHYHSLQCEKKLRADAFFKINGASAPLLARYSSGDLILITTKDPANIRDMYIAVPQWMLDSLFYVVVCAVFLFRIDWTLIFLPLFGGMFSALVVALYKKRVGKYFDSVWTNSSALSTTVQESVYGARTVASFAREGERRKIFARDNERLLKTYYGGMKMFADRTLVSGVSRTLVTVGELILAVFLGLRAQITPGEFTATLGYVGTLMWQMNNLFFSFNEAQRNLVSANRFFGFMHEKDETADRYGTATPTKTPSFSFRGVGVKNGENYALKNIDLDIPYGKKLGVMGRTGSGKTLLCKLLQGFAEADEGEILIDGKPVHEYSRAALAANCSYAMQNVFLFSNTITANISLSDPYAPKEQTERAGALAEVDEFARRFPDGYETTVGEKGFGLSGGQKQRISIARALFKNANVLVFDDVTSALDLETERSIFRNLKAECGDKTLVLVTHRATALKDCDEIIFLDRGEIVERGSFAELTAQKGNFAEIYERQLSEVAYEE